MTAQPGAVAPGAMRIREAQREWEKWVLSRIRQDGDYQPLLVSVPIRNAISRLEARGQIKYSRAKSGYILRVRRPRP